MKMVAITPAGNDWCLENDGTLSMHSSSGVITAVPALPSARIVSTISSLPQANITDLVIIAASDNTTWLAYIQGGTAKLVQAT